MMRYVMTVFTDQHVLPVTTPRFSTVLLSAFGAVVSLIGSVAIYAGSVRNDWSSVPVVIGIFLCGVVGLYCGVSVRGSSARSGVQQTGAERFLTGVSIVSGSLSVGVVLLVLFVMGLLVVIASR
jgi:hypothetical protein